MADEPPLHPPAAAAALLIQHFCRRTSLRDAVNYHFRLLPCLHHRCALHTHHCHQHFSPEFFLWNFSNNLIFDCSIAAPKQQFSSATRKQTINVVSVLACVCQMQIVSSDTYCAIKKQTGTVLHIQFEAEGKVCSIFAIVLMQLCLPKNNNTATNQMPNH
jgi:hypothetical protein